MINQPPMLQALDFQSQHSDMLVAARSEPLTKAEIAGLRAQVVNPYVYSKEQRTLVSTSARQQGKTHAAEMRRIAHESLVDTNRFIDPVPKDAKIGTQLRIRLPTDFALSDGPVISPYLWSDPAVGEIRVEASNQSGLSLVVDPLPMSLDVRTVFCIEGVTWYSSERDELKAREFIVTAPAAIGDRVIHLYPPIETPRTVNQLPKHGAHVFVKLSQHSAALMEG